jgi:Fur family peroxide stress response transcriptional regulator
MSDQNSKYGNDDRLITLSQRLHNNGLRATPQRLAILEHLEGNRSHPSAEEIYKQLKPRFPSLSMASIYSTLEALARTGELQELNIDPLRKRFDPDTSAHCHFFCRICRKVYDIETPLPISSFNQLEFLIESCAVNFFGICPNCQNF